MSDASAQTFKVTIEGEDFSFAREVDAPTLAKVMHVMLGCGLPAGVHRDESSDSDVSAEAQQSRKLSVREFLISSGAKRYPDKIVAIGYFLEKHEGKVSFSKEDLKSRFRTAGEAPPGNFPRDFSIAVSRGWIAEDAVNPRQLYVTRSGEEAVIEGFSGTSHPPRRQPARRRRLASQGHQHA